MSCLSQVLSIELLYDFFLNFPNFVDCLLTINKFGLFDRTAKKSCILRSSSIH